MMEQHKRDFLFRIKNRKTIIVFMILFIFLQSESSFIKAQERLETGSLKSMPDEWIDSETGHRIILLSRRAGNNESFYFNNNPFVPQVSDEGDKMVFYGSTIKGKQLFTVNLKTLKIDQLTDRSRVSGEMVCSKTREAFFQSSDSVFAINVDTKHTRFIYAFPRGMRASIATVNADGTFLAAVQSGDEARKILAQYPQKKDFFQRIYAAHIEHILYTINTQTKELKQIHKENTWLGHLLFSPTNPDLLSFCHEGPWEKVDRIWNINIKTGELKLMHKRTMENEIAGHEFFQPDGNIEWFDLQKPKGAVFFLAGVDVKNGKEKAYQLKRNEWSIHFNVYPEKQLFAGDGGDPGQVAKAPDGMWIYLFRPQGDHLSSEKLVNMKHHDYKLEPNVHFSPDGNWIIFRTNFGGQREIYAVEIAHR